MFQESCPVDFLSVCDAWGSCILPHVAQEAPFLYAHLGMSDGQSAETIPGSVVAMVRDNGEWLDSCFRTFHIHVELSNAALLPLLQKESVSGLLHRIVQQELTHYKPASPAACRFRNARFYLKWQARVLMC